MMCTYLQRKMLLMLHKIEKNWKKNVFGTVQKSDARGIHTTQFVVPLATALLLTVHFFFPCLYRFRVNRIDRSAAAARLLPRADGVFTSHRADHLQRSERDDIQPAFFELRRLRQILVLAEIGRFCFLDLLFRSRRSTLLPLESQRAAQRHFGGAINLAQHDTRGNTRGGSTQEDAGSTCNSLISRQCWQDVLDDRTLDRTVQECT